MNNFVKYFVFALVLIAAVSGIDYMTTYFTKASEASELTTVSVIQPTADTSSDMSFGEKLVLVLVVLLILSGMLPAALALLLVIALVYGLVQFLFS